MDPCRGRRYKARSNLRLEIIFKDQYITFISATRARMEGLLRRIAGSLRALIVALGMAITAWPAHAAELVMFEQQGCEWCQIWHSVIGPIYGKTAEGRKAPLRRVDISDPMPDDIRHIEPGRFTPTFVLLDNGREVGRIRGYPGEDFFWGMLGELIEKLDHAGNSGKLPGGA